MAQRVGLRDAAGLYERLLVDTCVLIDEYKRRSGLLRELNREQRRISVLSLWEFLRTSAALLARDEVVRREAWLRDQALTHVSVSENGSKTFATLLRLGTSPPGAIDCLLAAESLARGWPLVTSNVKHFTQVEGLRIVPVEAPDAQGGWRV